MSESIQVVICRSTRSSDVFDAATRPEWDYSNHPFRPQGNGIYCETCGGSRVGIQHALSVVPAPVQAPAQSVALVSAVCRGAR